MAEYNPRDFKDPVLDYDFNKIQNIINNVDCGIHL